MIPYNNIIRTRKQNLNAITKFFLMAIWLPGHLIAIHRDVEWGYFDSVGEFGENEHTCFPKNIIIDGRYPLWENTIPPGRVVFVSGGLI